MSLNECHEGEKDLSDLPKQVLLGSFTLLIGYVCFNFLKKQTNKWNTKTYITHKYRAIVAAIMYQ